MAFKHDPEVLHNAAESLIEAHRFLVCAQEVTKDFQESI